MAKISKGDLEIANEWAAFLDRLGWELYDVDTESGVARRDTGQRKTGKDGKSKPVLKEVTTAERVDIEATWRDQSNVSELPRGLPKIKDGTDG